MKKCPKCELTKELSEFHNNKNKKDGKEVYCKQCAVKRVTGWRDLHKDYVVEYNRVRRFSRHGITEDKYLELLANQSGSCAICKTKPDGDLDIDHDHKCCPGMYSCGNCIRGLLCGRCNITLGALKEDKIIISNMLEYINGRLVQW